MLAITKLFGGDKHKGRDLSGIDLYEYVLELIKEGDIRKLAQIPYNESNSTSTFLDDDRERILKSDNFQADDVSEQFKNILFLDIATQVSIPHKLARKLGELAKESVVYNNIFVEAVGYYVARTETYPAFAQTGLSSLLFNAKPDSEAMAHIKALIPLMARGPASRNLLEQTILRAEKTDQFYNATSPLDALQT